MMTSQAVKLLKFARQQQAAAQVCLVEQAVLPTETPMKISETALDDVCGPTNTYRYNDPEALLRTDNLTFEKAAAQCRAYEQSKQQGHLIHNKNGDSENESCTLSEVKKVFNDQRLRHVKPSDSGIHGPKACPAYGKKCVKCDVLNHFARSRRVRKVQVVEHVESHSSQESLYCDSVSVALHPVKVRGQIQPTSVKLKRLDGVITPVGKVTLLCRAKGYEAYINFMLMDLEVVPLLGLSGCLVLNLVQ
ncbi:hypothetical protein PR048_015958 [Dryococelus australis]|uniref:Uncharacterized protein n=1 Tax=Dryococelus australis TaxID=614101 RepID=A0ABQ9HID7_9NEOP|nr:hypothetical protein PR048_015958 [Dryococelus australis]